MNNAIDYRYMAKDDSGDGLVEKDFRDLSPHDLQRLRDEAAYRADLDLVRNIDRHQQLKAGKTVNVNPIPFPAGTPADALHVHYSGQTEPQQVFAALDLRDGEWTITYNGEIGNAVPADVWYGRVIRYPLDATPTTETANTLLHEAIGAAQAVLDAYTSGASQGTIDAAEDALYRALEVPQDGMIEWPTLEGAQNWIDYDGITAGTTDQQIADMAADVCATIASFAGVALVVVDGLIEHLTEERDSKQAAEAW